MLLVRYFAYVGAGLLALLFVSDAYLPQLPVAETAPADLPMIRIHTDRKWPERIVFDTSIPAIPATIAATADAPAAAPAQVAAAQVHMRDAFAQLRPPEPAQTEPSDPKRAQPNSQRKRKVAKRRAAPPMVLVAQQPQFGLFGNNTW